MAAVVSFGLLGRDVVLRTAVRAEDGTAGGTAAADSTVAFFSRPQPMLANATDAYEVVRLWPESPLFLESRRALEAKASPIDFRDAPLRDAVAFIADKADVVITIDHGALEADGRDADTPITATLAGGSWRDCLRSLLADLGLTCVFRRGRLVVTTRENAVDDLERVFYPVMPGVDVDAVAGMIEETIAPGSWSIAGGAGGLVAAPAGMGHGLVVSQTGDIHDQIEAALRALDGAHWQAGEAKNGAPPRFVRIYDIEDDDARDGLAKRLVTIVNESLPRGADPDASIEIVGRSLVVRSISRPFHVVAAQVIVAVTGFVQEFEIEWDAPDEHDESDEPREDDTASHSI